MTSSTTTQLQQWRQQARQQAIAADVSVVEVDILLREFCGWTPLDRAMGRSPSNSIDWPQLDRLWQQRCEQRIPLQYLLGTTPWRDLELIVSPAVLIPRPETEILIDVAVEWLQQQDLSDKNSEPTVWADLGTGSGAIAVGLARACPTVEVLAVDYSDAALGVARQNVERYDLGDSIQLLQGSWFEPLENYRHKLQGIISNPPYIPTATVLDLEPEVRDREPHMALDGGETGLDCLSHLVEAAPDYLQPGGFWLVELMQGQAPQVMQLLADCGRYEQIQAHLDIEGVERAVSAQLKAA